MRTSIRVLSLSLGLITAIGGATVSPKAAADDAGRAIVTVQSHCMLVQGERNDDVPADPSASLRCVAIYRNRSDRPVFDIGIDVSIGGRRVNLYGPTCCKLGTRQALLPGEAALVKRGVGIPAGVANNAPVKFEYRAAWTGDRSEFDVPRPELQYVDRIDDRQDVTFIGEARNVDHRALGWNWEAAPMDPPNPVLALFRRGKLVDAVEAHTRWSFDRVAPDGRYLFDRRFRKDEDVDGVEVFFVDKFLDAEANATEAQLQLTGLDHWVEADPRGKPWVRFRATVRNPSPMRTIGPVLVIARRADFHAIGGGSCHDPFELEPGAEASCTSGIQYFDAQLDGRDDVIHFLTVELGGAVAYPPTPTPTASATPCPALATPAPVPTLDAVAGRVWLPWTIRTMPERCP